MTNRKFLVLMLLFAVAFAGCTPKAKLPPRKLHEQAAGFSYDPPPGWKITTFPGVKYKICAGEPKHGFAPNINVVDEQFFGSLSAYVDANVKTLKKAFPNHKSLKRENFKTGDGESAIRLIIENSQGGKKLRQTFGFFSGGSRKYVATCTVLAEGGEAFDPLFDASLKTFRTH